LKLQPVSCNNSSNCSLWFHKWQIVHGII